MSIGSSLIFPLFQCSSYEQSCYLKHKKEQIIYIKYSPSSVLYIYVILIYFVHLISTGCALEERYRDGSTLKEVEDAIKMCLRINIDPVNTKIKRLSKKVMELEAPGVDN